MRTPTIILGVLFFVVLGVPAVADPLKDGKEAFDRNDFVRALLLLQPLADAGNARAQTMVGNMFLIGCCGVAEDAEAGVEWLRKAAVQADGEAESLPGAAYLNGRGAKV